MYINCKTGPEQCQAEQITVEEATVERAIVKEATSKHDAIALQELLDVLILT